MDDFTSKITQILNDPDGMQKIQSLANSIMGESKENIKSEKTNEEAKKEDYSSPLDGLNFNPEQMGNMMKIMGALNSKGKEDNNTRLLLAIKPHLSQERAKKVDRAISMLKIAKLLPILQQDGLLQFFGG